MNQEHLDQIVTEAVLTRISQVDFKTPRARRDEDVDGTERRALELEIKRHKLWLDAVERESRTRQQPTILASQERIVTPRIEAARARLNELAQVDRLVLDLTISSLVQDRWDDMTLDERRHVIQALVVPRINPTSTSERGQRGPNWHRVDLFWR